MSSNSPKVFISHASEDKKRFVEKFAAQLREKGIEAWLDKWEILPGDSLVDKIFNEGLGRAQAAIVVLSENSVDKPWVKAELNAAVVKKIYQKIKLIPVVIDECEIPPSLSDILWVKISDLNNCDAEIDRIVLAVFGIAAKPPVGKQPDLIKMALEGLEEADSRMLRFVCETMLENNGRRFSPPSPYLIEGIEMQKDEIDESLGVLEHEGLVKLLDIPGGPKIPWIRATVKGFELYAQTHIANYSDTCRKVASLILNEDYGRSYMIVEKLALPSYLIEHILHVFEEAKYIELVDIGAAGFVIYVTSPPAFKRTWGKV